MTKNVLLYCLMSIALSFSLPAWAKHNLDLAQSQINFISIKNEHIAESHSFDKFTGSLTKDGQLEIIIDLTSVNTIIPIRNVRMQKMLFEVSNYATASFQAQIDTELTKLGVGESRNVTVNGQFSIKDKTVPLSFDVRITGLTNNGVNATTVKPTILSTAALGLNDGVDALQKVAMLNSISQTVPLTFSVVFTQ